MVPIELRYLICSFAKSINHHRKMCVAFGLLVNRRHIYYHYWTITNIPVVSVKPCMIRWIRRGKTFRYGAPAHITRKRYIWYEMCTNILIPSQQTFIYRTNDRPTYVFVDGNKFWTEDGLNHRIDGPAVIKWDYRDLTSAWYIKGVVQNRN